MAKQKESKTIYVTNKNNPKLKSYQDSLSLYNKGEKKYNERLSFNKKNNIPNLSTRKFNDPVEYDNNFKLTKNQPIEGNGYWYNFNPDFVSGTKVPSRLTDNYGFRYKKPTQKVEYIERTYQKESDPIKSKSIKGVEAKLPDLKRVEGPSKWMRSFGAGASENYWSKVDAQGKELPGYFAPNKNAVQQPYGPTGEDYQVRESIPLGMTQFNKDKK